MINDFVNGTFEALGGFFVLNHCAVLLRDKSVAGVSILSTAFFASWAFWNLYYYPTLNQTWSTIGSVFLAVANSAYVLLLIKYKR